MKPGVYLAGPMARCTPEEMNGWREEASRLLVRNFTIFNPVSRDFTGRYQQDRHEQLIVEGDKSDIRRSEVVLANIWKTGTGTCMEIMYAHMIGVPVIIVTDKLQISPWYSYHAKMRFPTVELACGQINSMWGGNFDNFRELLSTI
jgi:nucleoside 2-deoxyribosyltransferase